MANTKINAASLTTLPARKQPYRDEIVSGLCLQVGAQRRRWFYQYRQAGKLRETTLGFVPALGLADARAEARAVKERIEIGAPVTVPPAEHPKDKEIITVGGLIDLYEKARTAPAKQKKGQQNKKQRGLKSLPKSLKAVRSGLADYINVPAKDFTKYDMRAALAKIAGRGAYQMADRFYGYCNPVFDWAAKNDHIEHNPCAAVEKIGPGKMIRDRVLDDNELRAIWAASFKMRTEGGKNYGALVRFLMIVPLRLNEARLAVHGEFLGGRIRLHEDRNKAAREFRLSLPNMALDIIGQGTATDRVFPKTQSLWRLKNELDDLCGITGWRTHDLRRTIATRLQDMGTPPHVIGALLNHSAGTGAAGHYLHGEGATQKAEALALWAAELEKILSAKSAAKM
ncbi:integrase family protein [Sinorhizobium medicae WSM1115]|nr:integrase family protein [Sinorhizobium medicae]UFX00317.1 integrase family protein [Sinorhizobium medicae WSM1115]